MSVLPENVIVGKIVDGLTESSLGIHPDEETMRLPETENFLPRILVQAGFFKSTSIVKQVNAQRIKSDKFKDKPEQSLWRNLTEPEMTYFKIGKKTFWLIVGENVPNQ